MKREYQVTESELFDFFNDKLSVEEEKEILEWKEACDENRHAKGKSHSERGCPSSTYQG